MRNRIATIAAAAMGAGALAWGSAAHAQEVNYFRQSVPAPSNAFELQVGTGYTQGIGNILPGQGMPSVAGPGIAIEAGVAYRSSPHWSEDLVGQYQEFANELNSAARGLTGGGGATYHLNPALRGDPYVRMGGGFRMLWSVNPPGAPTTTILGLELAKATVGYDLRLSPDFALSPQVGADLDMFLFQDTNGRTRALSSPQVATFVFAGLAGRFDMSGTRRATANVGAR